MLRRLVSFLRWYTSPHAVKLRKSSDVYWTVHHCNGWRMKDQLDVTCWFWVVLVLQAEACKTSTTQNQPHQISNTQRTENKTTDVVIQQYSRKLLMMDILMSEICWAHKKWNKIASDIKLVFHSSTILMQSLPVTSHLLQNAFLITLFSNTLILCSSIRVLLSQ